MFLELPESITLKLKTASFGSRALAYTLDACIRWGFISFLLIIAYIFLKPIFDFDFSISNFDVSSIDNWVYATSALIYASIEWFYATYFEVNHQGQTPGKKAFGLKVISKDGLEIDFKRSAIRNIVLFIDLLPGLGLVGMITMVSTKSSQRLGDIAAGTLVIYSPKVSKQYHSATLEKDLSSTELSEIPKELHGNLLQYMKIKDGLFLESKVELEEKLLKKIVSLNLGLDLDSSLFKTSEEKLNFIYSKVKPAKTIRE